MNEASKLIALNKTSKLIARAEFEQVLRDHVKAVGLFLKDFLKERSDLSSKEKALVISACSQVIYQVHKALFSRLFKEQESTLDEYVTTLNEWTSARERDVTLNDFYHELAQTFTLTLGRGSTVGLCAIAQLRLELNLPDVKASNVSAETEEVAIQIKKIAEKIIIRSSVQAGIRVLNLFFKKLIFEADNVNLTSLFKTFSDNLKRLTEKEKDSRIYLIFFNDDAELPCTVTSAVGASASNKTFSIQYGHRDGRQKKKVSIIPSFSDVYEFDEIFSNVRKDLDKLFYKMKFDIVFTVKKPEEDSLDTQESFVKESEKDSLDTQESLATH